MPFHVLLAVHHTGGEGRRSRTEMSALKPRSWKWVAILIATESWSRTIRFCVIMVVLALCSIGTVLAAWWWLSR
jgi:hypothetical protein